MVREFSSIVALIHGYTDTWVHGYTDTRLVACGWEGAIFEVARPFGQEQ